MQNSKLLIVLLVVIAAATLGFTAWVLGGSSDSPESLAFSDVHQTATSVHASTRSADQPKPVRTLPSPSVEQNPPAHTTGDDRSAAIVDEGTEPEDDFSDTLLEEEEEAEPLGDEASVSEAAHANDKPVHSRRTEEGKNVLLFKLPEQATGMVTVTMKTGAGETVGRSQRAIRQKDGTFRAGGLNEKVTSVAIAVTGWAEKTLPVSPIAGQDYDLGLVELDKGISLSGTVRTANGVPISHAQVSVTREHPISALRGLRDFPGGRKSPGRGFGARYGETDSEGAFTLDGFSDGSWTVEVTHGDYATQTMTIEFRNGAQLQPLMVEMSAGGTLTGMVSYDREASARAPAITVALLAGTATSGAAGEARIRRAIASAPYKVRMNDRDEYTLKHVAVGRYTLIAQKGSKTSTPQVVDIYEGSELRIDVVLR